MLLQFDLKHIHKVNFYPSDNNFTQALLVMLVTNIISDLTLTLHLVSEKKVLLSILSRLNFL